jgi:hypothetical protein
MDAKAILPQQPKEITEAHAVPDPHGVEGITVELLSFVGCPLYLHKLYFLVQVGTPRRPLVTALSCEDGLSD